MARAVESAGPRIVPVTGLMFGEDDGVGRRVARESFQSRQKRQQSPRRRTSLDRKAIDPGVWLLLAPLGQQQAHDQSTRGSGRCWDEETAVKRL